MTETVPEKAQILNLLDKVCKSAIINMFKELKKIMCKILKERMRMMYHKIENVNKETEIIKKRTK